MAILSKISRISFKSLAQNCKNSYTTLRWMQKPISRSTILKTWRICGFGTGLAAITFRKASCAPKISSKRIDHLRKEDQNASMTMWELWELIRPFFGWFFAAVVCAILSAYINIQIPLCLGDLVNGIVGIIKDETKNLRSHFEQLKPSAMHLMTMYVAQSALTFLYITFLTILGERMATKMRSDLFAKLLHHDMAFFDSHKTGELSARLNADVQEFKSSFKLCVSQGLRTFAQTIGCIGSLYFLSPTMTMYTVAVVPGIILAGSAIGAGLRQLSRRAQAQSATASAVSDEALTNMRTIRAFAMEKLESRLFDSELDKARSMQEQLGIGIGIFQAGTNLFLNGMILSVLYGGSNLISKGEMTPGALMSFLVSAQTIQRSLSQLSIIFGTAIKGWTAGGRVLEFSRLEPSIPIDTGVCIPYHTLWGDIKFEDVSFSYPTRPGHNVFEHLTLTIPAGQVVALCGPSGEGKSTITHLLERFYEPKSGRVTLDGRDMKELNVEWLRGQVIGLISQEPVLFATSVEENIRYGRPDATDEEVRDAARAAHVDEFVSRFPNGYSTVVGERGAQLSGGQKQRIAIARAILKNPPILILDEATSALDSQSEQLVQEALNNVMKGRTVLVIAHRLSTIRSAQLIYVIKDKKALESGTHEQLMAKKGSLYRKLVEAHNVDS
ncbi:hypothetical protein GCK72_002008 [Caenorhabditis remanei]|uniref:Mitochondrial potassium channel ATP-binding subunit n=1 Tax=Caenorhabditis remanei TaxID=31234 RepID=A0A6A5HPP5_CAERE|nr:hypothetical protein GCK72_002008 [Caenorhabditis remanei]KAF1770190.1 hypothetical protein GCK72_002008 [Caenorhabditis remanei]